MKKQNWIWIILAILIIVIVVVSWRKLFGKKNGTEQQSNDYQGFADALYNRMNGITIGSAQGEVNDLLENLKTTTDNGFISIWNAFGTRDGYNLAEWVEDEWYISDELSNSIKSRATSLGLN